MCKSGQQRTLDDNGDFLNWFVGEPKVERAIAYETRAPSEARLPNNRLLGQMAAARGQESRIAVSHSLTNCQSTYRTDRSATPALDPIIAARTALAQKK
jgi:hypothetical protein